MESIGRRFKVLFDLLTGNAIEFKVIILIHYTLVSDLSQKSFSPKIGSLHIALF